MDTRDSHDRPLTLCIPETPFKVCGVVQAMINLRVNVKSRYIIHPFTISTLSSAHMLG